MALPENVEQLLERYLSRVIGNLYHFGVTSSAAADIAVRRVLGDSSGVPDGGVFDARDLAERLLHAPEAARSKSGGFELRCVSVIHYVSCAFPRVSWSFVSYHGTPTLQQHSKKNENLTARRSRVTG